MLKATKQKLKLYSFKNCLLFISIGFSMTYLLSIQQLKHDDYKSTFVVTSLAALTKLHTGFGPFTHENIVQIVYF